VNANIIIIIMSIRVTSAEDYARVLASGSPQCVVNTARILIALYG